MFKIDNYIYLIDIFFQNLYNIFTMELKQILDARERLANVAHITPCQYSTTFSKMCGNSIYLKCENLQKTGSFKVRGAYNKIAKLYSEGNLKSIVASSAGNHAQGCAFAASKMGIDATICMPRTKSLKRNSRRPLR